MYDRNDTIFRQYIVDEDLQCGGIITQLSGVIQSADRDNNNIYDDGLFCLWLIIAPKGSLIELRFLQFAVEESPDEDCRYDSLTVHTVCLITKQIGKDQNRSEKKKKKKTSRLLNTSRKFAF